MKKSFVLLTFLFSLGNCYAQNLVPNPSFEIYDTCPTNQGQIKYATSWHSFGFSPDYFNSCNQSGWGVPHNNMGFQKPVTGNAYVGIGTFVLNSENREYIGTKLNYPLIIGQKYYVNFKACLSDNPSIVYASNKLGALFSTNSYSIDSLCPPPCINTLLPPKNFAQVFSDSIIRDTANWTTIFGSFIADSAYQYIIIGNHFDVDHTSVLLLDSSTGNVAAYYLIDDVYVGTDSLSDISHFFYNNNIDVFPNPATDIVNINIHEIIKETEINIIDIAGRKIKTLITNSADNLISVADLERGVYFITLSLNNRLISKKLILN